MSLAPAIAAYRTDPDAPLHDGWQYGLMDAALLGLAHDAATKLFERANTPPAPGYRFAGFAPHKQGERASRVE